MEIETRKDLRKQPGLGHGIIDAPGGADIGERSAAWRYDSVDVDQDRRPLQTED